MFQTVVCLALAQRLGLWIVAFSSTIYMIVVDVVSFASLRRSLGPLGLGSIVVAFLRACVFGVVGAAVGALILRFMPQVLGGIPSSTLRALISVVAGGIPSVLVTFGLAFAFHVPEVAVMERLLARLTRRG